MDNKLYKIEISGGALEVNEMKFGCFSLFEHYFNLYVIEKSGVPWRVERLQFTAHSKWFYCFTLFDDFFIFLNSDWKADMLSKWILKNGWDYVFYRLSEF